MENLLLRNLEKADCQLISQSFTDQGWNKPISQYQNYLKLQIQGKRDVIVATVNDKIAGYLTIDWMSKYSPFNENGIPEIVDLNVVKKFQRNGIATALILEAEDRIRKVASTAGIGVGLLSDYGSAQRLYVKLGYIPDGRGIIQENEQLKYNDIITMGDDQVIYFTKSV